MTTKEPDKPEEYGHDRSEFQAVFDDEAALERRIRCRRRLKSWSSKAGALALAFSLGVASSYVASLAWAEFPAVKAPSQHQPTPPPALPPTLPPAACVPSDREHGRTGSLIIPIGSE